MNKVPHLTNRFGFRIRYLLINLALVLIGLVLFLIPMPDIDALILTGYEDKLVHIGAFAIFTFYFGIRNQMRAIIPVIFLGILIEAVQLYIPDRSACIYDMASNCVGIGIGFLLKSKFE